jgi:creatinine amidohydrolase
MSLKSRYLPEMSWPQVQTYLMENAKAVILPLGSTENHGPHAPLGTDSIIIEELCRRLAPRVDAIIAPVLPLGFCPQHLSFVGSISLRNETLARVLLETASCLADQGFVEFILISGHGGNRIALELAAANLKQSRPELLVIHAHMLVVQTSRHIRSQVEHRYGRALSKIWEAHGGEQETAAVMAVRPELVGLENSAPEPDVTRYLARGRDHEVAVVDYDLRTHAPAGNWGDPRGATAEQGEVFFEVMAEYLAERIRAQRAADQA